jgi:mono/diheme cytochrome c family protein
MQVSFKPITILLLAGLLLPGQLSGDDDDDQGIRFFESRVRPLLVKHCYKCHGEEKQESDLRVDSFQELLRGGATAPAVVPGRPDESLLIHAVGYTDQELQMPPSGRLTDREIADLTEWVKQGAPHPEASSTAKPRRGAIDWDSARRFWSFRPLQAVPLPVVRNRRWPSSSIDFFVLQALEHQGLKPAPPADRRTLLRRATLDLTGLPPRPEEVEAFVADDSPDAYQRLVERLLASPQYGERWGRFWLDVARYSDSNGLDENIAHGNAWRYRDYVIAAFNSDKPYDRFLHEQLAGDLMEADDHATRTELKIATGFLSLGPKVLAEQDVVKMEMDIIDEQIDTIGRSLMGLTLGCSRCHDHKFDPLTTRDYYALAGIFKSTRTMESFETIARWNENSIALPEQQRLFDGHQQKIEAAREGVQETTRAANEQLLKQLGPDAELPEKPGEKYPQETRTKLAMQQAALKKLEESLPSLPTAMGVVDQEVTDLAVHIRGSHLSLGEIIPRRVPELLSHVGSPSPFGRQQSGRRELAAWLTHPDHPLTSRVMANRIWRWHFGRGIVSSTDNFGKLGAAPTHPDLLDHLAAGLVGQGWSIKQVHRWIMLSSTYRMSSRFDGRSARLDPANEWLWRFPLRRLEAEAVRDSLLAVSGLLDLRMGGSMLHVANREFFFDHTSIDKTKYDSTRRSVYLPVVRNHLFDLFSLFDYTDASMINGNRSTSTIAPQALFMMNSDLIEQVSRALAESLLDGAQADDPPGQLRRDRLEQLYLVTLGRLPRVEESSRAGQFLERFLERPVSGTDLGGGQQMEQLAWQALCQVLLASNEFIYVR